MSQQDMNYSELNHDRSGTAYGQYEGTGTRRSNMYGEKLASPAAGSAPTAGQRLALAIVSLGMLIAVIFGLIAIAIATQVPNWAIIPILFIITLFAVVAAIINVVFNRHA